MQVETLQKRIDWSSRDEVVAEEELARVISESLGSRSTTMTQAETFTTLSRVITALQAGEAPSKDLWLDDARKPDVYVLDDLRSLFPSRIDFLRFIN